MNQHGFNSAAMFYCVDPLWKYEGLSRDEVQTIAYDVALLGQRGLVINDPANKYTVNSLPDTYSGIHMLCYIFAGFKIFDSKLDAGIDLGIHVVPYLRAIPSFVMQTKASPRVNRLWTCLASVDTMWLKI